MLSANNQKVFSIISGYMGRLDNIFKFYLDKECFTFDPQALEELRKEREEKEEQTKNEMLSAVRDAINGESAKNDSGEAVRLELAKRVFDLVPPWDHEEDETVETTAEIIRNNPEAIIEYLLNLLD